MIRFIAAFWLGICLYFGTFLAASPSLAVDNASQTRDTVKSSRLLRYGQGNALRIPITENLFSTP